MMSGQNTMQMIIIGIILLCGYIYLLQMVLKRAANKSAAPFIAIVLLVIYGVVSVVLLLTLTRLGTTEMTMLGLLIFLAAAVLSAAVYGLLRNFRELNKGMLVLFLVYLLGLAYITLMSRSSRTADKTIRMVPFASLSQLRTSTTDMLNHMLLNVAMFVPLGLLFPLIYPAKLGKFLYAVGMGLMCTVIIESVQMMFQLGQCDVDDMIANTIGAIAGYLVFLLYQRVRRRGG